MRNREHTRKNRLCAALVGAASLFLLAGCGEAKEAAQTGIDQLAQGAYAEAAESFSEALSELKWYDSIDKTQLLLYRAEALMGAGEFESARAVYDGLLEDEPDNADYALYAGLASLGAESYVKAEKSFETAIENGSQVAYYYAGKAAEAQKAYTTAAKYYAQAAEEDSIAETESSTTAESTANADASAQAESVTQAEIYEALARCLMQTESYEEALSAAESGLETAQEPEKQSLLYMEAVAYEYLGDFETAREKMDAYVQQYPDDTDAQKEDTFLQTR